MPMQPLRFQPILKRAIWGGHRLGETLSKVTGPERDYAESWEVSDLPGNESIVQSGTWAGTSLRELMISCRQELLGRQANHDRFPLLIKFLDARKVLSVQVHPSAQMAARRPEVTTGKAEAWIVLEAEPSAVIYAGLKPGVTESELRQAILSEQMEPVLHSYFPRKGDCFFLRPGTVHALGGGLLVAEVQQPNDVTYRLYDWGRVGPDGRPRQLHLELGLEATNFLAGPVSPLLPGPLLANGRQTVLTSEFFLISLLKGPRTHSLTSSGCMSVMMVIEGSAQLNSKMEKLLLPRGTTVVIPAECEPIELVCDRETVVIEASVPNDDPMSV